MSANAFAWTIYIYISLSELLYLLYLIVFLLLHDNSQELMNTEGYSGL